MITVSTIFYQHFFLLTNRAEITHFHLYHITQFGYVSAMNYYTYRLMIRNDKSNHILRCRQLFHQYIVDMFAEIEHEPLLYLRLNQSELRAENYTHLRDAILKMPVFAMSVKWLFFRHHSPEAHDICTSTHRMPWYMFGTTF